MRLLDGIIDTIDMSLSKLGEMVKDREAWHTAVHGVAKSQTRLSDSTTTNYGLGQAFLLYELQFPYLGIRQWLVSLGL